MNGTLKKNKSKEFTSFGAIHLKVADLNKAKYFWTSIGGLKIKYAEADTIAFGTDNNTLVVVHDSASTTYLKGFSGLYHFAIHVSDEAALASVIHRLDKHNYAYSPVDHTMSKAVYLEDLEGITVEFTLETPDRVEANDNGNKISGPKALDVRSILAALPADRDDEWFDENAFIGHVHLYANNVTKSNEFYKTIGFTQNKFNARMAFADLGSGGDFGHRIAMNSWHGTDRPLAPADSAGLDYFELVYSDKTQLSEVISKLNDYEETKEGYWIQDPTGNRILLN